MKLLTWNVFWRAMNDEVKRCINQKCVKNIDKFLHGDYDMICLQECSNWKALTALEKYQLEIHNGKTNVLITAFNKSKYKFDYSIKGSMADDDRLFMISFFSTFVIINIHAGHNHDIDLIESYISKVLDNKSRARLAHCDLILAGDFNDPVNKLILFKRILKGQKTKPTCCYSHDGNKFNAKYIFDHIITTVKLSKVKVHSIDNASDHKPVTATIALTPVHAFILEPETINEYIDLIQTLFDKGDFVLVFSDPMHIDKIKKIVPVPVRKAKRNRITPYNYGITDIYF